MTSSTPAPGFPPALPAEVEQALHHGSQIQQALAVRLMRVAARLIRKLDDEDVMRALSAATDIDALAVTLERAPLLREPLHAETAAAYARGRAAREQLLNAEGGVATSEELGELLSGISRQAVDKRRRAGRLLALRERGDWVYPRWQVEDGQTIAGLEDVLEELAAREHDPWAMLIFFLQTDTAQEGESPLAALRSGKPDAAIQAARTYGEHGAR
jgi:hypothetical protein